jgi:hypothetical protein
VPQTAVAPRSALLRTVIAALTAVALLALPLASPSDAQTRPAARVTVAVIDSGINPYHDIFQREQPNVTPDVLAEFGIGPDQTISLTRTGDFDADFANDKPKFDAIETGKPYWFEGTNVIGISFDEGTSRKSCPTTPATPTASASARR